VYTSRVGIINNQDSVPVASLSSSTSAWDGLELLREVSALHRALFGSDSPPEIANRYIEAHGLVISVPNQKQLQWMQAVLNKQADLEALELVLRRRQPDHVLCQKVKVLTYIVEAFPEYYSAFINEEPRRARAYCILAWHVVRTLWKRLKGWWLLRALGSA
jgi:hypothetical protein